MTVPVKLFGFVFWLFSLNCAQCQDSVGHYGNDSAVSMFFNLCFASSSHVSDITCEVPHDQHVSRPQSYFRGDMKLGATKYYSCLSDYEETAAVATCTRDGWTPKPLCTVKMCAAPNIANADIVGEWRPKYQIYSRIQYKCHPGFEPKQPVQITCNHQPVWTGIQQCTEMCGPPPNMDFAEKTKMTKNEYRSGERVEYSCLEKYTLEEPDSKYLTCEQGQWRGKIKCLKPCSVTMEEMNKRGIKLQWGRQKDILVEHKDSISFVCQDGKDLKVNGLRQSCNDGVMTLPECV